MTNEEWLKVKEILDDCAKQDFRWLIRQTADKKYFVNISENVDLNALPRQTLDQYRSVECENKLLVSTTKAFSGMMLKRYYRTLNKEI